jgi:hypothetical protein
MSIKPTLEEEDYIPALLGVDQQQEIVATALEKEDYIPALLGCVD